MTAAASKYSGNPPLALANDGGNTPGAMVATTENVQAASVPSAINENMFRLRFTTDCQPRTRNGQPAHRTTGVASASSPQADEIVAEQPHRIDRVEHLAEHRPEQWHTEHDADNEPARHVRKLRVRPFLGGRRKGFERHAADRASAGRVPHEFRDASGRSRSCRRRGSRQPERMR